jgi:hypothetical protein
MAYQEKTKEEALRDCSGVKKHWIKILCNNMKKPMDKTGEDGDRINRCMAIEKKIMMKTHSGLLGFTSEEEGSVNSERETENTGRGISEGCLTELAFDLEYDEEGNPNATPAPVDIRSIPPLLRSPRTSPIQQQEMNVDAEGVAPAPATNAARDALRTAESSIKAQKTKNSSNKHKERMSIVGAIVKLIEQGQGSSSSIGATMNMTLMRQMEHINKSMDNQDKRETKERKKERKRWRKRRAKNKAKKARKRVALEGLEDHGGKARRVDSSSSSSSDSEDNESSSSDSDHSSHYDCGSWQREGGIVVDK